MKGSYKNLLIGVAAGGAILLVTSLYDRYIKSHSRKINPQRMESDLKDFGSIKMTKSGLISKSQVAFILGLAKRYSPDYFQGERRKSSISRQTLLARLNDKMYIDALVDAVNLEYRWLDDLCYEICQKLGIPKEVFTKSRDHYLECKDAEFTIAIQNAALKSKEEGNIKLKEIQAKEIKQEMKLLMKEAIDDPNLRVTTELKVKLRDGDLLEMHQKMLEIRVLDLIMQRYGIWQRDIEEAFNKYELDKSSEEQSIGQFI